MKLEDIIERGRNTSEHIFKLLTSGEHILLHGSGGTGKSHITRDIFKKLCSYNIKCALTATTGIASLNMCQDGVRCSTIHSWSGIQTGEKPAPYYASHILSTTTRYKWENIQVLIIDEISMMGKDLFAKLDYIGRVVRKNPNVPFGDITLLLIGDFLQLPPVNDEWVFKGKTFQSLNIHFIELKGSARYSSIEWEETLERIRTGNIIFKDIKLLKSRRDAYIALKNKENLEIKPTILYSRKDDVRTFNLTELNKLETKPYSYIAKDTFKAYKKSAKITHYKRIADEQIDELITLKKGAQVMLKVNLDVDRGLVNGSRGVVVDLNEKYVIVKFLKGITELINFNGWEIEDKEGRFVRKQIPLVLGYAITIHKSQSLTLDMVEVDLGKSIFADGQAYVALSRVRSIDGLYISNFSEYSIKCNKEALIFIYEMLNSKNKYIRRNLCELCEQNDVILDISEKSIDISCEHLSSLLRCCDQCINDLEECPIEGCNGRVFIKDYL